MDQVDRRFDAPEAVVLHSRVDDQPCAAGVDFHQRLGRIEPGAANELQPFFESLLDVPRKIHRADRYPEQPLGAAQQVAMVTFFLFESHAA